MGIETADPPAEGPGVLVRHISDPTPAAEYYSTHDDREITQAGAWATKVSAPAGEVQALLVRALSLPSRAEGYEARRGRPGGGKGAAPSSPQTAQGPLPTPQPGDGVMEVIATAKRPCGVSARYSLGACI